MTNHQVSFAGAVLAGGASRRMGTDKAFIEIDGSTLLQRVGRALYDAGATSVFVVGGDSTRVYELGLCFVEDIWPAQGPLAGIISALRHTKANTLAILSCDLLQPSAATILLLREAIGESDVVVPKFESQAQWLHAVWNKRCLPHLEHKFFSGARAPKQAVKGLSVSELTFTKTNDFRDADEPSDLGQEHLAHHN